MLIKPEQLAARLKQSPLPLVWISGEETLLVQEACDTVRTFAKAQGFSEREVLDADANFNWNRLLSANNSLSLFAERKLIDLRLTTAKVDEAARETLLTYVENPNPDNLLLLTTGKIEKQSQNTKWFKGIESKALFCQVWPVSEAQLPQWIRQRLQQHGLQADQNAIRLLAERVEGNLLAAAQEIEKLAVLSTGAPLDVDSIGSMVADSSRFDTTTLIDACLAGHSARALKILTHLQAEGEQSLGILARLTFEIRRLAMMRSDMDRGLSPHGVMEAHGVWSNRTQLVGGALGRHTPRSLQGLLEKARLVDQTVKGLLDRKAWDELADLVLGFSKAQIPDCLSA